MSLHEQLLEKAKASGLRRTKALEAILECLATHDRPMTLSDLTSCGHLAETCDQTTVFRLLQRLIEKGMVRRLGFHERAAYFVLLRSAVQGDHPSCQQDYLICTECGSIEAIQAPCPVHQLEEEIRKETGYQNLHHELEFFGICPKCSQSSEN
ncbi:MAG: Fur family transcriptional regulator [Akkermansiaceae bacterium]